MKPESLKVSSVLSYASGTATRNSTAINMAGFEWVMFVVQFATIAASAVTSVKLQQSSDNGSADDFSDVENSAITVANDDDNQLFVAAQVRPGKQYVRCVVVKDGTNAAAESAVAIQGGGGGPNLASVTDALTLELAASPSEGTA